MIERQRRVALRQLKDAALGAALGGANLNPRPTPLGEHLSERPALGLRKLLLNDYLRRNTGAAGVVMGDELGRYFAALKFAGVVEVERLAVGQHAVTDLKDLRVGFCAVGGDGNRVERACRLIDDSLAFEQRANRVEPVALSGRALIFVSRRGGLHPRFQLIFDLAVVAGEKGDHAVDVLAVVLLSYVVNTWCLATFDVVIEAWGAGPPTRLGVAAGTNLEDLLQHLNGASRAAWIRIRAEVDAATAAPFARQIDPRELLVG